MTAQPVPQDYKRLSQSLPALKGLAIFLVVVYHLWGYTKGYQLASEIAISSFRSGVKKFLEGILNIFCLLGEQGVAIFIMASGFGLASSWWRTSASKDSRRFEVIGFWRRRLLRLFPLYWLAHGLALLQALVQPAWVPFGRELLNRAAGITAATVASLTTLRNFIPDYYFFLNAAWWYVGLAVQLYLIFPLLVTVGKRWGWPVLLLSSLGIEVVYRQIIVALPLNEMATDVLLRGALFPSRLFEFAFGIFLAVAMLEPAPQKWGASFECRQPVLPKVIARKTGAVAECAALCCRSSLRLGFRCRLADFQSSIGRPRRRGGILPVFSAAQSHRSGFTKLKPPGRLFLRHLSHTHESHGWSLGCLDPNPFQLVAAIGFSGSNCLRLGRSV